MSPRPASHLEESHLTDKALIDAAQAGNEAAWDEITHRYAALVYSIPARYGMDQTATDDVFQEVFTALLSQLDSIRNVQSLPKWFITTTHRICWRMMKKSGREATIETITLQQDTLPDELVLKWERQQMVRLALERLGGRCADLLSALYRTGVSLDYSQIARELDMPIGSIGPTRARCLQKLMNLLSEMGFPPD